MKASVCLLLFALPLVAQHGRYESESTNPAIGDPVAIAAGSSLYLRSCSGCHGPDGSGGRGPNLVQRKMWHPLTDEAIFTTVRNGLPGADMPPTNLSDEETWQLVAFIHALIGPAAENPTTGDVASGEAIFWGSKVGCSNCHAIRGKGGKIGPDLTNIGGQRPLAVIKKAIVNPSDKLYYLGNESVTAKLKNGEAVRGVAKNRDVYSIQIIDRAGKLHLLTMNDIAELEILQRSPMPGDYAERLTADELENLLAFLARQTLRPAGPEAK